eukprot:1025316-Amorphochlora_amoeboformis.AAC.1
MASTDPFTPMHLFKQPVYTISYVVDINMHVYTANTGSHAMDNYAICTDTTGFELRGLGDGVGGLPFSS